MMFKKTVRISESNPKCLHMILMQFHTVLFIKKHTDHHINALIKQKGKFLSKDELITRLTNIMNQIYRLFPKIRFLLIIVTFTFTSISIIKYFKENQIGGEIAIFIF